VLLATPPDGHLAQAAQIFAAGLPLLAEKPLTVELDEARRIVALADEAGLPLMVGLNFRFLPVSQSMRSHIAEQTLGAPGFSHFSYQRNRDGRLPRLNKYPLTMRHPMMLEQSIHHLDLIRFCLGSEVESVTCRTWNPPWSMYAHDSNVHCLLRLQSGVEVNYFGTWTGGWNQLQFEWRVDCAEGVLVQRQLFDDLALARTTDSSLTPVALPACEPFIDDSAALFTAFAEHLAGSGPLLCSGADHLITLALCFAAIESSETDRTVNMAEFCARHDIPFPA
jgi:predicted dehydrogenase